MRTSRKPIPAAALALAAALAVPALATGQGYLGIELIDITEDLRDYFGAPRNAGTLVAKVTEDGPAAVAGLEVGDVITGVAGEPVGSAGDVVSALAQSDPGDQITVEIVRYGAPVILNATLGAPDGTSLAYFDYHRFIEDLQQQHQGMVGNLQREHERTIHGLQREHHNNIRRVREDHIGTGHRAPAATGQGYLGIETMDLSEAQRVHFGAPRHAGRLVIRVVEDSPAAAAGFEVRDVVTRVAGYPVGSQSEMMRALAQRDPGDRIAVEVVRYKNPVTLNVTLGARKGDGRDSRQRPADVVGDAQERHDETMRQLQHQHDETMRQFEQRHRERMSQARLSHGGIIGELQGQHQDIIRGLYNEHQGIVRGLHNEHRANIRGLREAHIGTGRRARAACIQDEQPRGAVNADVGGASVSVDYGRPVLGDRTLDEMLDMLSEDWVWRAGENEVTMLDTTGPVRIGSETVPEGRYSLYLHFAESGDSALLVNRHQGIALGELWPEAPEDVRKEPWPILDDYGRIEDQEQARIPLEEIETSDDRCVFEITADEGMLRFTWGGVAYQTTLTPS